MTRLKKEQVVGVPGLQLKAEDPQGHHVSQQPQDHVNHDSNHDGKALVTS